VPAERIECPVGDECRKSGCLYHHSRRGRERSGRKRGPGDGDLRVEARERDEWRYGEDGVRVYERDSEEVKRCCNSSGCRGLCGKLHRGDRGYVPRSQVRCRDPYDRCEFARIGSCLFYHSPEEKGRCTRELHDDHHHSSRSRVRDEGGSTKRIKMEGDHRYEMTARDARMKSTSPVGTSVYAFLSKRDPFSDHQYCHHPSVQELVYSCQYYYDEQY